MSWASSPAHLYPVSSTPSTHITLKNKQDTHSPHLAGAAAPLPQGLDGTYGEDTPPALEYVVSRTWGLPPRWGSGLKEQL